MKKIVPTLLATLLAGCFTLQETPYPETAMSALPEGKELSVQLRGFKAVVTEYLPVYGYDTIWVEGRPRGRYGWTPGHYRTITTSTYIPQVSESDVFMQRAKTLAESSGFTTMAQQPDYIVDVAFEGPFVTDSERGVSAMWMLLSLLSADYSVQTWAAKLKIYNNKTGKLVFHQDYVQRYETKVFGLIPLFGIASCAETTFDYMQGWCLSALTDRVVADVTAILSGKR